MKRLQVSIPADMDEALAVEAARSKTSKAALIREFVGERLAVGRSDRNPMTKLIGAIDSEPGDIDEVVYERRGSSTPPPGSH